jgi:hypothetical protein
MIMRWISEVPSKIVKIVKIVDGGAVSAGRWPIGGPGVSTHSARVVRGRLASLDALPGVTLAVRA